jgi:hypothetical protein
MRHAPGQPGLDPWWWLPHYSTRIERASEVLEYFQKMGAEIFIDGGGTGVWYVRFECETFDEDGYAAYPKYSGNSTKLATAIALAAMDYFEWKLKK